MYNVGINNGKLCESISEKAKILYKIGLRFAQ